MPVTPLATRQPRADPAGFEPAVAVARMLLAELVPRAHGGEAGDEALELCCPPRLELKYGGGSGFARGGGCARARRVEFTTRNTPLALYSETDRYISTSTDGGFHVGSSGTEPEARPSLPP